ncbi:MAG: dTDP-4-dehydrorhamnose 3,5-epimerase [Candidatus Omnitrophota bacterium]
MAFNFRKLEISDVILIEPAVFSDDRGFFMETYKYPDFSRAGISCNFLQDNHSKSSQKGVLRGLHYQVKPKTQSKLVRVARGSIFDVAVDLRGDSPNFGKWISVVLSAANKLMLYIPEGFAHGYCTLDPETEVIYKCSDVYAPEYERGIIWNDKEINIAWPIQNPVLSGRDMKFPALSQARAKGLIDE